MEIDESILRGISVLSVLSGIALFASPYKTVQQILQKKSTENRNCSTFISGLVCPTIWLIYGVLRTDLSIIFVNFTGVVFGLYFLSVFYYFSNNKGELKATIIAICVLVCIIILYVIYTDSVEATTNIGLVGCASSIALFASPLIVIKKVVDQQSSSILDFRLSIMIAINTFLWLFYGWYIHDNFVLIPNVIGLFLAFIQLTLIFVFPSKSEQKTDIESI
eukprot:TRINITY_DN1381_c0_g1_i1.p1 TRINITY_DN1381_c0_g1~~TRINITY_DN1381_c0_g1_i1.p1  ORF type:complete len:254 (+),score=69.68 TRINITY_DN1381_c0_g1_i1:104-763(+)